MPIIQNFSVPAGDDVDLNFDIDPDDGVSLVGSTIYWRAYAMTNGVPDRSTVVLQKYTDNGLQITDPDEQTFVVEIERDDTLELLRNYFHEATVNNEDGSWVTVTQGIMTVTETVNRPESST